MLPASPLLYGALLSVVTNLKEFKTSEGARERLSKSHKSVAGYVNILKDIELDNPVTWAAAMYKGVGIILNDSERFESHWEYIASKGLVTLRNVPDFLESVIEDVKNKELVYVDEWVMLFRVELSNGARVWYDFRPNDSYPRTEFFVDRGQGRQVIRGLGVIFWENRRAVEIDLRDKKSVFGSVNLESYLYRGQMTELIEQWRKFMKAGVRRNILVQGAPGNGKTTLCYHAANLLSDRTLILSHEFCSEVNDLEWKMIIDILQPEVVIVNDIDRLGAEKLSKKLRMFEEGYCNIPLTLFTSNDISAFPDAMLRPGRIDQKIVVSQVGDDEAKEIVKEVAQRVGIDIPEYELESLVNILRRHSPSHVKEYLRRCKVLGWEHEGVDGDITFELNEESGEE